jgi:serine/threonine protein kinase
VTSNSTNGIELNEGFLINDRYLVEGVLGVGGFGVVYRSHDKIFDKTVAIKEFLPADISMRSENGSSVVPRTAGDTDILVEGVSAFLSEARTLHDLRHRNIVEVTDFVHAHGTGYLVMPYHKGKTLGDLLGQGEVLSSEEILDLTEQVLSGLEYVHNTQLLHRDISPGNLFIKQDGTVLLIDFGASRHAVGERSQTLSAIVKPGYAPFEQYHARGNQGPWTDIYALGATLYRCVTGEAPPVATERMEASVESGQDPVLTLADSRYAQTFAPELLRFIDHALALQPSARPQSVESARQILVQSPVSSPRPDVQPPPRQEERASMPPRRSTSSWLKWVVASVGSLALLGTAALAWQQYFAPSTLLVTSVPSLAEVFVDGDFSGLTPLDVRLDANAYSVEVRSDGNTDLMRRVELNAGDKKSLDFELIPIRVESTTAYLIVRSNVSDDIVFIDDRATGPTGPTRHEIPAGPHTIRVTRDYYADWGQSVALNPGEERIVTAELRLQPESCETARNNQCDEPYLCPVGTDTVDCSIPAVVTAGPDSCQFALDNECDEPNLCSIGTDTSDCAVTTARSSADADANTCQYAFDSECDEPNLCSAGTDTADCSAPSANSCTYAFDNECDEPNICGRGTDSADCTIVMSFGNNASQYANDGECDDPRFVDVFGDSMAASPSDAHRLSDATDCRSLFNQGRIRLR